jgi:hypothetical protein
MPTSIRLLMFGPPDLVISLRIRSTLRLPTKGGGIESAKPRCELSNRLPPHLVRDVLPD